MQKNLQGFAVYYKYLHIFAEVYRQKQLSMEQKDRQRLIKLYESKSGGSYRFRAIINHFSDLIAQRHNEGMTIEYIKMEILQQLEYDFGYTQNICPFYRAIYAHIKKLEGGQKKRRPIQVKAKIPIVNSNPVKHERMEGYTGSLGSQLTNDQEAKELFNED